MIAGAAAILFIVVLGMLIVMQEFDPPLDYPRCPVDREIATGVAGTITHRETGKTGKIFYCSSGHPMWVRWDDKGPYLSIGGELKRHTP